MDVNMDDPSYEDLLDENYELHEEIKVLNQRLQSLDAEISDERKRGHESELRAAEIGRLQKTADSARHELAKYQREAEQTMQDREAWTRTRERLEAALREKDERLSSLLRGRHGENDNQVCDGLRHNVDNFERDLLEADKENEKLRADLSVLESQVFVLQGALTVTAAERDEILAMRERAEAKRESQDKRILELQSALTDAQAKIYEISLERDEIEKAAQKAARAIAGTETSMRIQLETTLAENAQLRESTVTTERAKADGALLELKQARAECERLDCENVELAVLADLLRQRIKEVEHTSRELQPVKDASIGHMHTFDLQCTLKQELLEGELASYEAELAEDRELLEMAAEQSGIGIGEAIRRYKQLKSSLRAAELELEKCQDQIFVQQESCKLLECAHRQYKGALEEATSSLCRAVDTAPGIPSCLQDAARMTAISAILADRHISGNAISREEQLERVCVQMQSRIDDLVQERSRLLERLRENAIQISQSGVRLVGLSPDHIQLVRAYASALSSGLYTTRDPTEDLRLETEKLRLARRDDRTRKLQLEHKLLSTNEKPSINEIDGRTMLQARAQKLPQNTLGSHKKHGEEGNKLPVVSAAHAQSPGNSRSTKLNSTKLSSVAYGGVLAAVRADVCPDGKQDPGTAVNSGVPDDYQITELRDVYALLSELLETLDLSERKCMELGSVVTILSGQLSVARQQIATCYDAHFQDKLFVTKQTSSLRTKLAALRESKEIIDMKLEACRKMVQNDGKGGLLQRTMSYEVNELLLKRRHAMLGDEVECERNRRVGAEQALVDLDTSLRGRILYLEVWKHGALARIECLQSELQNGVPGLSAARGSTETALTREEYVGMVKQKAFHRTRGAQQVQETCTAGSRMNPLDMGNSNAQKINTDLHNKSRDARQSAYMRQALLVANKNAAAARRDCMRLRDTAAIASAQAAQLTKLRDDSVSERDMLMQRLRELEVKSDDNRLIGRLQREAIALRTAYQLFARNYETMSCQLRRKQLMIRKLEMETDVRVNSCFSVIEDQRAQVDALKSVLGEQWTSDINAPHSFASDINDLQRMAEQHEVELSASESVRVQLEVRIENLNLQQGNTARGLIPLAEEVTALKLQTMQDRRRIASLQEKERQLVATITSQETMLLAADRARVEAETHMLLKHKKNATRLPRPVLIKSNNLMRALGALTLELRDSPKANNLFRTFTDEVREAYNTATDTLEQEPRASHHDESAAPANNTKYLRWNEDSANGETIGDRPPSVYSHDDVYKDRILFPYGHKQGQTKQIISATISSLKALVDEKARALENADEALQIARRALRRERGAAVERADILQLTEKLFRDHHNAIHQLRNTVTAIEEAQGRAVEIPDRHNVEVELTQLHVANQNLERRLRASDLARGRAESHCAQAVREAKAQKADLVALAAQLKQVQERAAPSHDKTTKLEIEKLKSSSAAKENKLRGLKESLTRLKTQLVAAQEANTSSIVQHADSDDLSKQLRQEINLLTSELHAIRKEAKTTRCDIDIAHAQRDKYKEQFQAVLVQLDCLRSSSRNSESRCRDLDNSLSKARKECRNLRILEAESY